MPSEFVTSVRHRISVRGILVWAVTLAVVVAVTDDPVLILGIAAGAVAGEILDIFGDIPGVDERWGKAAVGLFVMLVSAVWLLTTLSRPLTVDSALPIFAIAVGGWLLLDARADFVQGRRVTGPEGVEEMDGGEAMLAMQHMRLIALELKAGPKTVPELAAACDLTESRVIDAIDLASEDGTIYQFDTDCDETRYAVDEQKLGLTGVRQMVSGGVGSFVSRLFRPFFEQL
ncbi:hypothetical protein ACFQJ7_16730 [Halovenus rubra]|uniref:Uncharacterized protein n=2 Tax=Halovenus rubra TaxID=869890 RepID=A0ABD5XDE0_9EURY|nr:hypothetical protein [Halovenus rubra]